MHRLYIVDLTRFLAYEQALLPSVYAYPSSAVGLAPNPSSFAEALAVNGSAGETPLYPYAT